MCNLIMPVEWAICNESFYSLPIQNAGIKIVLLQGLSKQTELGSLKNSIFPIFVDIGNCEQWPVDILEDYLIGSK